MTVAASTDTSTGAPSGALQRRRPILRRDPALDVGEELCAAVLGSLRRRDQREKGRQYVLGLLATRGRKSIRNIATHTGGVGAEQSLHHFISDSTWDWQPIRAALAEYLGQLSPLTSWVVQPMSIPKGGEQSVGTGHRFDPHRGQMFRGQQAFGVWFCSPELTTPAGWRLFLPEDGSGGTPHAGVDSGDLSYEECAATAALDMVRQTGLPARPIVLDVRGIGTRATMNRFTEAGLPVLARIDPGTRLLVTDPALPGHGAGTLAARDVLRNVRGLRLPVKWADPLSQGRWRTSWVSAVRVMMPDPSPARRRHLMLVGDWVDPTHPPAELWITDMLRPPAAALLRMTKQTRRVTEASRQSAQEIGLRDFSGRSLSGWHRHVTMASVAHAARALAEIE
ncbi:transposase [Streptomyces sp. NPDC089799]|uniref:IS701 family transposase n=1 Tax=Streptomyces sp. NPDC089799 TaxID=3155066 RepID=UPI003419289E